MGNKIIYWLFHLSLLIDSNQNLKIIRIREQLFIDIHLGGKNFGIKQNKPLIQTYIDMHISHDEKHRESIDFGINLLKKTVIICQKYIYQLDIYITWKHTLPLTISQPQ